MHWTANPYRLMKWRREKMKKVKKTWGSECWFANTKDYCGKLLIVESGKWSSDGRFHYHELKDESFFVIEGRLWLDIASEDGEYQRITLERNDSYRVMPGVKHRFSSATEDPCEFIEASTHHEDSDSFRCKYDREKGEWLYD